MRFVIFSGTTEGRKLSALLAEAGADVTVCVASDYGSEEQGVIPGVKVRTGPLSAEEKQKLLRGCALCVDATHPYATHVTASVREACRETGVPYVRLLRPASETGDARCFESAEDAAGWLSGQKGNILLTTMQGPFSEELNRAIIRQYRIRYLVSKDGGVPGGFPEKAAACRETGTELILLRRPEESGPEFETVYQMCMTLLKGSDAIE